MHACMMFTSQLLGFHFCSPCRTTVLTSDLWRVLQSHRAVRRVPLLMFLGRKSQAGWIFWGIPSLKLTAKAPENRPGPYRKAVFQPSIFRGELLVSGRVYNWYPPKKNGAKNCFVTNPEDEKLNNWIRYLLASSCAPPLSNCRIVYRLGNFMES